jgi:endonuclease/exonuclease/phosphatase family metal-dependent hydrolase
MIQGVKCMMLRIFFTLILISFSSCISSNTRNEETVLKVTTYNVNYFSRGVENVARTISKIDPDVIAMQEVLVSDGTDYSRIVARKLGYHHVSSIPYQNLKNGTQWVLSFLSKYPVVSVKQTQLDRYRRVLKIEVKVNGSSISLATTHLSPMVWRPGNLLGANNERASMRRRELSAMLDFIGEGDEPILLLGDLNSFTNSEIHRMITSKGYADADDGLLTGNKDTFAIDRQVVTRLKDKLPDILVPEEVTLDYIFTRGKIRTLSTEVMRADTSDHYPLTGKFVINPK